MHYVGRFAPSPSGPLHFGSLVAAVGSYLQAKANNGKWLVRIEDIDPPREVAGSATAILRTLEAYSLNWDDEVLYQHTRHDVYQAQIDAWLKSGEAFYCQCTRRQIKDAGGFYPGTCRLRQINSNESAVRVKIDNPIVEFTDIKHGLIKLDLSMASEDFIIKRRDGLFAYNLAVVLDDIYQGVTQVVRGADLIEPTGRQVSLYQKLGQAPVSYLHLPLALNADGNKLSKQNHAPAINNDNPGPAMEAALAFLGHAIPQELKGAQVDLLLAWGVENWQCGKLPSETEVITAF
ncbi:tRNA glutamyl-Q(34) synthetase GluQRS [Enterovibrio nigricans]|uniref:Glutamyl-Q tRNA(Asp) synthetase n=1 Tax=Enterovibrio nigricans DSM 22720 TaxID=1121868 RepID=A0A1T4TY11_9GAMM|nr:tRNA glutamyl-Q(34) synthetase GluQRS [Enterovibrio nigricans]PKF49499.1 tRNA glutamyl-Q(34) synthetase GluQRS [Enterovibrio nigricans]SKA45181.1 glutamyl-Q tRNA(Asp) synthetase [Enterovibrio nigricans DSM 22720]